MPHVSEAAKLYVSADRVWETIGDFTAVDRWHPGILKCEPGLQGTHTTRKLDVAAMEPIVERLDEIDHKAMVQRYSLVSGPLPLRNYHATIHVRRDDATSCTVEWSSSFDADGVSDEEAVEAVLATYRKGLDHLRFLLGG